MRFLSLTVFFFFSLTHNFPSSKKSFSFPLPHGGWAVGGVACHSGGQRRTSGVGGTLSPCLRECLVSTHSFTHQRPPSPVSSEKCWGCRCGHRRAAPCLTFCVFWESHELMFVQQVFDPWAIHRSSPVSFLPLAITTFCIHARKLYLQFKTVNIIQR